MRVCSAVSRSRSSVVTSLFSMHGGSSAMVLLGSPVS
jgi:hypothetical protein